MINYRIISTVWKIMWTLLPRLATWLVEPRTKWKCRTPTPKVIKNFKIAKAEHSTAWGPFKVQIAHLWSRPWPPTWLTCMSADNLSYTSPSIILTATTWVSLGDFLFCSGSYTKDYLQCQFPLRYLSGRHASSEQCIFTQAVLYSFSSCSYVDSNHEHEFRTHHISGDILVLCTYSSSLG